MPGAVRPRWVLHLQAQVWRFLMGIGMFLHRLASPRPPKPTFTHAVESTVSDRPGTFDLHFYTPADYKIQKKLGFKQVRRGRGYPLVVNFHGGGFTLGSSSDDGRWIGTVVDECQAIVVSVDYRLAPEFPFPTAVEDGVDAVLWCAEHAEELGIDADKIALSGFSSGGNMAFTVPLRLYDHLTGFDRPTTSSQETSNTDLPTTVISGPIGSVEPAIDQTQSQTQSQTLRPARPRMLTNASCTSIMKASGKATGAAKFHLEVPKPEHQAPLQPSSGKGAITTVNSTPSVSICAIIPWYPSTDYTRTREQRRATTVRKDQDLPALFTDLFDESYLHPPDTIPLDSPYLSPGIASSQHLKAALPMDIIMHTCEWDMLLVEGQDFHKRLTSDAVGKKVVYNMIKGVPHGWDKAPNPLKPTPGVKEHYLRACKELRRCFQDDTPESALDDRRRQSVAVVR